MEFYMALLRKIFFFYHLRKKQKTNNESLLDIFSRQVAEYSQELKTILQNASK